MTPLRRYRMAYGYEQQKLASKVHVSPGYLCDLEHGIKSPSAALARVIADIFGAKVEAVFPEGVAPKDCRKKFEPTHIPAPEVRGRRYPRGDFGIMCWHCKRTSMFRADDHHLPLDDDPRCPSCGARFGDVIPLGGEAANV